MSILEILCSVKEDVDFAGSEDFFEDGYLDSFDIMVLVEALENEFDIEIRGVDIIPNHFKNVKKMEELVKKYTE